MSLSGDVREQTAQQEVESHALQRKEIVHSTHASQDTSQTLCTCCHKRKRHSELRFLCWKCYVTNAENEEIKGGEYGRAKGGKRRAAV